MENQILKLKLIKGEEIRLVRNGPQTLEELIALSVTTFENANYKFQYTDEEGDHITIGSDIELLEAYHVANEQNLIALKVYVIETGSQEEIQQPSDEQEQEVQGLQEPEEFKLAPPVSPSHSVHPVHQMPEHFRKTLKNTAKCAVSNMAYMASKANNFFGMMRNFVGNQIRGQMGEAQARDPNADSAEVLKEMGVPEDQVANLLETANGDLEMAIAFIS